MVTIGNKTREIMTTAIGRVLFIDEAYRLMENAFMMEAANEIVQLLTEPKFQGKLVVVLAGRFSHQKLVRFFLFKKISRGFLVCCDLLGEPVYRRDGSK